MIINNEKMKDFIRYYCDLVGSCEKCALSYDNAPNHDSCYTHCTEEELIDNYNFIREWGEY